MKEKHKDRIIAWILILILMSPFIIGIIVMCFIAKESNEAKKRGITVEQYIEIKEKESTAKKQLRIDYKRYKTSKFGKMLN